MSQCLTLFGAGPGNTSISYIGLKALQRKDRLVTQPADEVAVSFDALKIQALYLQGTKLSLNSALDLIQKVKIFSCQYPLL